MASYIPRKGPGGKRVWQAHVRRRGYPAQTRTFDTKAEAEAWAGDIESMIRRGTFGSRIEAENTTLAEALDRYQTEVVARCQRQLNLSPIRPLPPSPRSTHKSASLCQKDADLHDPKNGS